MSMQLKVDLLMLITACLVGCRAPIDDVKLTSQIRAKNPSIARLQGRFPDLNLTSRETQISKHDRTPAVTVQAQATLENGDNLIYHGTYKIDSDGNALTDNGPTSSTFLLWRSGCQTVSLTADEFERLVEAAEAKAVLNEIGIDFERGPIDANKVVSELRQIRPQIERVLALSSETRSTVDVPAYRHQGTLFLTVPLGKGFTLTAAWEICLPRGDGAAKLMDKSDPTFLLSRANSGDAAGKLTTENIESLLNATDPAQAAQTIWNGWHR